jgi:hypothetical protein
MVELFFKYADSSLVLSYDNKNRVKIGTPCVNRFNKAKRWFMEEDRPKLPTHDYPKSFKIIPSVYLQLKFKKDYGLRIELDELGMLRCMILSIFLMVRSKTYPISSHWQFICVQQTQLQIYCQY